MHQRFFKQSRFYSCSFAFLRFISCKYLFSKPLPLMTPSHLNPGRMLNLFAQPWYGHRSGWVVLACQRRAGSSQISISSSSELYYFFIPFYHSPKRCNTFCSFIYFYLAFENYLIVPSLFRYIVLACSGIYKSDEDF